MSKYILFNKEVVFSDSADRFCNIQFFAWSAARKAKVEFEKWYIDKGNIYNVLTGYCDVTNELVKKYAIIPLFNTLATEYKIYDISRDSYIQQCLNLSPAQDIHDEAIDIYNDIEEQLAEEKEYRELRKASRGEVVGGGFGLGGAIAGMATAGAINMATGAAHSIANSIGNASSTDDANARKLELYNACRIEMSNAIEQCILKSVSAHIDIVNEQISDYIVSLFDSDKANAFLESAQNVPEKRIELLVEAFKNCPWKFTIYSYIFDAYPDERKNIIAISKDFQVDLQDKITELFRGEYTEAAKESDELAIKAKHKILTMMSELGVSDNHIINEIEIDCLNRLCNGYKSATEKGCEVLIQKVKEYDASDENKNLFFEKLQKRIEEIWAKEDGDIFDNYLLKTDILNIGEIEEGIKFIKERGRTENSKKYLTAFESFKDIKNIKKARKYRVCAKKGVVGFFIKWIGGLLAGLGVILFFVLEEFSFWNQLLPIIAGIIIQFYMFDVEAEWEKLTINNKAVHKILVVNNKEFNDMCNRTSSEQK